MWRERELGQRARALIADWKNIATASIRQDDDSDDDAEPKPPSTLPKPSSSSKTKPSSSSKTKSAENQRPNLPSVDTDAFTADSGLSFDAILAMPAKTAKKQASKRRRASPDPCNSSKMVCVNVQLSAVASAPRRKRSCERSPV